MTRTRHATHPLAVPVVARDAVGAVAGALPTAPRGGHEATDTGLAFAPVS